MFRTAEKEKRRSTDVLRTSAEGGKIRSFTVSKKVEMVLEDAVPEKKLPSRKKEVLGRGRIS